MSTIGAVIFDMDGLLVNSEPLWRKAEIEVFGAVSITLTEAMCIETTGLRIDEVVGHHFRRTPWEGASPQEITKRIVDRMVTLVTELGEPLEGALEAVALCQQRVPLALASSSPIRLIETTLARLGIAAQLTIRVSAENETHGKPHPGVFLSTAEALGVEPTECLVFEDSVNGVVAAKAARMLCIAIPEPMQRHDPRFAIADRRLDSLADFDEAMFDAL